MQYIEAFYAFQFTLDYDSEAETSIHTYRSGPTNCRKFTSVIELLECRGQLCDVFKNIVWCHNENNAPHYLKSVSFVKGVPDFENPENVPKLIVLNDLMDCAHSTKVSELLTLWRWNYFFF